jgi:hypothetical protein
LMMNLGAFMESEPKAYERFESLWRGDRKSYTRTIELDDAILLRPLRIGKMSRKLGIPSLDCNFTNQTVHEDPLLDKDGLPLLLILCTSKLIKALFYVNKALSDWQSKSFVLKHTINSTWTFWRSWICFRKQLNLGYRTRYVVVLGYLQF